MLAADEVSCRLFETVAICYLLALYHRQCSVADPRQIGPRRCRDGTPSFCLQGDQQPGYAGSHDVVSPSSRCSKALPLQTCRLPTRQLHVRPKCSKCAFDPNVKDPVIFSTAAEMADPSATHSLKMVHRRQGSAQYRQG
ncbi:hypothetical protein LIA77_01899 [Sarocladium implicatum]|nr:hypothetical protein LIA77_01899 [Sarocladium implicatum]